MPEFNVRRVSWAEAGGALAEIRRRVFVLEQRVPEDLEWDGLDDDADHLLAVDADGHPIGCARLLDNGHIGRMAVLPAWRGRGVGRLLLDEVLALCRQRGHRQLFLNAQVQVTGFYERFGFKAVGEEFQDAGIPHLRMERCLD